MSVARKELELLDARNASQEHSPKLSLLLRLTKTVGYRAMLDDGSRITFAHRIEVPAKGFSPAPKGREYRNKIKELNPGMHTIKRRLFTFIKFNQTIITLIDKLEYTVLTKPPADA